jgi:hypothetical protein
MAAARLYPICLSTAECATALRVSRKIIHEMVRAGLPRFKIGTKTRIFTSDLVEFCHVYFKQEKSQ